MDIEKSKPEKANVYMYKTISQYETLVCNTVDYNDDYIIMVLDAIMQEVHNYDEEDRDGILKSLEENGMDTFEDGWEITLVLAYIEPFTEKQLDKDMFLTIKYPAI